MIRAKPQNPFFHRGPIKDASYFIGRKDVFTTSLALVDKAQSISIVAPRRMGKTSVLFQLLHQIRNTAQQAGQTSCVGYLDCGPLSQVATGEVYEKIIEALQDGLDPAHSENTPDFQTSALPNQKSAASLTFRLFEQFIRKTVRQHPLVVVLLDEFDALSQNPNLRIEMFSGLRALAMRYDIVYITATTRPLLELTYAQTNVLSSPFFNFFAQIRLGLFQQEEAGGLLNELSSRAGLPFDEATIEYLNQLAGRHPFLLQIAAYHAFNQLSQNGLNRPLTPTAQPAQLDVPTLRRQFEDEARPHHAYYWSRLSPSDQRLLATLSLRAHSDSEGVLRLEQAGLVVRDNQHIRPFSTAFARFVARQPIENLHQAPPVVLDDMQHLALLRGEPMPLTPGEFNLLRCLVSQPGEIVSHQHLESCLADADTQAGPPPAGKWPLATNDAERLKTTIKSLRKALGADAHCIENEHSVGYRFICAED